MACSIFACATDRVFWVAVVGGAEEIIYFKEQSRKQTCCNLIKKNSLNSDHQSLEKSREYQMLQKNNGKKGVRDTASLTDYIRKMVSGTHLCETFSIGIYLAEDLTNFVLCDSRSLETDSVFEKRK